MENYRPKEMSFMTQAESTVYGEQEIRDVAVFVAGLLVEETRTKQRLGYRTPARISLSQRDKLAQGPPRTSELLTVQPTLLCIAVHNEVFRLYTTRNPLKSLWWQVAGVPWLLKWSPSGVTLQKAPRT